MEERLREGSGTNVTAGCCSCVHGKGAELMGGRTLRNLERAEVVEGAHAGMEKSGFLGELIQRSQSFGCSEDRESAMKSGASDRIESRGFGIALEMVRLEVKLPGNELADEKFRPTPSRMRKRRTPSGTGELGEKEYANRGR